GLALNGAIWLRQQDKGGIAMVANGLSNDHRDYLKAGGLGFQLGDGALSYAPEAVLETYYCYQPKTAGFNVSANYQLAFNPGYNSARGPLQVFSIRVHATL
ncbi:MAG: hypothetical protein EBZ77_15510, partial [Chitinophagia bacterium]|nr:hypothetical protein [Chitinophagia bacterium]